MTVCLGRYPKLTMKLDSVGRTLPALALGLGLAITTACNREENGGHANEAEGHDQEEKTVQVTIWANGYEIFAEYQPIAARTPVTFVTHVTDLATFKPRTEGPVRFVLRQGDTSREQVQETPNRPGIYLPEIVFPQAGEWEMSLIIPNDGGEAVVPFPTLHAYPDEHAAARAEVPEAPSGVSFLKEQQWKIGLTTELVDNRELVERVALTGETRSKPGSRAVVIAPITGQIGSAPDQGFPRPGQQVAAGQVLAVLQPTFSEAGVQLIGLEAERAQAQAALEQAESAFQRIRRLAEQNARSEREVEEARLQLATARARYEAAKSLRQTYASETPAGHTGEVPPLVELRAPIAGFIDAVASGPGEPVQAQEPLFVILNLETLWIEAPVPEASLRRMDEAGSAIYETPGEEGEYTAIADRTGQLVHLGRAIDPRTRTAPVIYEINNVRGELRAGQYVNLYAQTHRVVDAVAVPEAAIVDEDGRAVVFVHVAGETFEKRELTLGIHDGPWVQALSGLSSGERVATRGAYAVRLASVSTTIPAHGHVH